MLLLVQNSSAQVITAMPAVDRAEEETEHRRPARPAPSLAGRIRESASRLAGESPDVTVDCRALEQLGGAPLQVLLALATEVESRGGRLTLDDAGPLLIRLIALGGIYPRTV